MSSFAEANMPRYDMHHPDGSDMLVVGVLGEELRPSSATAEKVADLGVLATLEGVHHLDSRPSSEPEQTFISPDTGEELTKLQF